MTGRLTRVCTACGLTADETLVGLSRESQQTPFGTYDRWVCYDASACHARFQDNERRKAERASLMDYRR